MSTPSWSDGIVLRCPACAHEQQASARWTGCASCGGPYEPVYADGRTLAVDAADLSDLGERATPLLRDERPATWLKLESVNPTGSHKDRFHAVTSAIARLSGAVGVATTSTGNHGVSCAAHAARDGLPCTVLATGAFPPALAVQIAAYGARVVTLDAAHRRAELLRLVAAGWMPATASDPALSGAANPFGSDGYRAIADEIVDSLGRLPDLVAIPVASGDLLVGVCRGLHAVATRLGAAMPLLAACQPESAPSLSASLEAGRQVELADPRSIARSTSDPRTGRLALAAVRDHGAAIVVSEARIAAATRELAARGVYVETSSALAYAGVGEARTRGLIAPDASAVAVLTATGRGWSEQAPGLFAAP